jgi:hypothetical protein
MRQNSTSVGHLTLPTQNPNISVNFLCSVHQYYWRTVDRSANSNGVGENCPPIYWRTDVPLRH